MISELLIILELFIIKAAKFLNLVTRKTLTKLGAVNWSLA
jgi:hypothetical protein